MIFNSNVFLIFLAAAILLYWLVRENARHRDILILSLSLLFYGWWDWRFVFLLLITGGIDFVAAKKIADTQDPSRRKHWLWLSLISNLGTLGFFKYADFFIGSTIEAFALAGISVSYRTLSIVLPAGISFYTFQALAYTIDVYRGSVQVERNPIRYFAFLTFFPQLVAGPIERASFLISQFREVRLVTQALVTRGIWLITWGFFQKVALADYFGPLANLGFGPGTKSAATVILATTAFGGQIYCDFAGYSLIARGVANLFGFELSPNFTQPYLAGNIQEFWRRWHQTLSTWFRDYVYIPLGGDRAGNTRTFRNIVLTFTLAGLWHGANWTFILWGVWHGLALALYRIWKRSRLGAHRMPWILAWPLTMIFVGVGWLFFRATSLEQVSSMLGAMGNSDNPVWILGYTRAVLIGVAALLLMDIVHRRIPLDRMVQWPTWARGLVQGLLLIFIIAKWGKQPPAFIYFQF